ncbi:MAG: glycosyltransferase family 4 protein [Goleter apudmare HA4340-LM2]|jgi:glycosyltransferase involved in cell wall biosynthesis|nr:glycosyltransferase family 4 protein [Goleter apudmare HA4340-LM2]
MGKKILIISPTPSHPQNAGNRVRINNLITSLKNLGYDIYFLYINQEDGDVELMQDCWGEKFYLLTYQAPIIKPSISWRLVTKIKSIFGREHIYIYSIDDWYDKSVDSFIQELQRKEKFDMVIVEYVFLSKALENFDHSVLKIIDTHDVFTNRHNLYLKKCQSPEWYFTNNREEAKGLNRADVIIAIQLKEANFFRKISIKPVIQIGHLLSLCKPITKKRADPKLLFIASSNTINVHGLDYFLEKIFPLVRSHYPSVELLIAGGICQIIGNYPGCIKLGFMEDVGEAYQMSDIVINPILFGTGLKIKSIEALGYSKALVTTSAGAMGLEAGKNTAFLVADEASAFAKQILLILNNPKFFQELTENAYKYAEQYNQNNLRVLQDVLNKRLS